MLFGKLHFLSIDRDATVRADDGTGRAACAGIGIGLFYITITSSVDHLVGQLNEVEWARHRAEVAAFAALLVDDDGPFDFSPRVFFYVAAVMPQRTIRDYNSLCNGTPEWRRASGALPRPAKWGRGLRPARRHSWLRPIAVACGGRCPGGIAAELVLLWSRRLIR